MANMMKRRQNMREDMFKVIVERPRLIHGNWLRGGRESGFRDFLASEDRPAKFGMQAGHQRRKWPNENLAPLRRFLVSRVGHPWDKVRSELLNGIDQRNTVQQHILTHVDDYVLQQVRAVPRSELQAGKRGVVFQYRRNWYRDTEWHPVEESRSPLFVDPRTGILRETHAQAQRAKQRREEKSTTAIERASKERTLDDSRIVRCVDDVWYEVTMAQIPGAHLRGWQKSQLTSEQRKLLAKVWDVLEKRWLDRYDADTYVTGKRQLSSKEIAKLRLRD
jgi:hypothetical protein